ncbi:hypothetical protein SYNTR_1610 [Candidatus Syntrophocurvum alkaliphilum]|uniref:Spore coat protein F n=1 Tax=Candidatus Syntrophocurvum alkaliphilum TaxID=2293317 RepID=A0A6I6DJD2_9FIRM|nr:spore coat protein [Candidatus Syntrophocurvum alkaliphilum]QGU00204.1 hypothetical protein SYNTR_1610 [Candidatus Syntrophocurvum alkaliphilum]
MVYKTSGMDVLNDQIIATDLLITSKQAVKSLSSALTEITSPEARRAVKQQLDDAIRFHEQVSNYTMQNGWYDPYDLNEQIKREMQSAQSVMHIEG